MVVQVVEGGLAVAVHDGACSEKKQFSLSVIKILSLLVLRLDINSLDNVEYNIYNTF